ncbi:MAG: type II toxin-antitoxin system RelE/ParE family toxin [Gammaproteobacteria bacterium]|nr:type II toxin-antitoxin system RelE/ParE family toxin [Gammaproteobacteria bacterium]
MNWIIQFHDEFEDEFDNLNEALQDAIFAKIDATRAGQASSGTISPDALHGSSYAKMKEPRCRADNHEWRILFAFDPGHKLYY